MRKTKFLILSTLLIFLLQSCGPGIQDFQKSLTDNYDLNRSSSAQIVISPKDGYMTEDEIIPTKVVRVNVYENYIIAERLDVENEELNDSVNNKIPKKEKYDYWIIDSDKKQVLKKLSYSQFLTKCDSLKIPRSVNLIGVYSY